MSNPWTFAAESPPVATSSALTLIEGSTFLTTNLCGDVGDLPVSGLFVGDTRVCSRLLLLVDGQRVEPLASVSDRPEEATYVSRVRGSTLLIRRHHQVGGGLRSTLELSNVGDEPRTATARVAIEADLAGLFEVKEGRATGVTAPCRVVGDTIEFGDPDGLRGAVVVAGADASLLGDGTITWTVVLEPRESWSTTFDILARRGDRTYPLALDGDGHDPKQRMGDLRVGGDIPGLAKATDRGSADLDALLIVDLDHPDDRVVAAGAPWFMTLFGRDSILTSWMALMLDPALALSTARTLARLQGTRFDPARDEQPGKILHEVRFGESPSLALGAGDVYYGSADATPLFVLLIGELYRWGVPLDDLRPLLPHLDAALDWMAGPGDSDGDGYIEYERQSDAGLVNQGWKDSWDGVSFASGELATAPIALAEVQAYAYGAWLAGADLADAVGDDATASARRQRAADLRLAFNRDFWLADRGIVALALDGHKRPVDSLTSNPGHCLWTGILDPEPARAVAEALVSPELFSGWGIRTLASTMPRYNPLSYHNGSVWPHDTAICVAGLRRAGFTAQANEVAVALLGAAEATGGRLPELFSGLGPDDLSVPVAYPASCSPQAWASAAPLLLLRAFLGFEPDIPNGRLVLDPALPEGFTRLDVSGIALVGTKVSIQVDGDAVAVRALPPGVAVLRPPP